MGAAWQAFGEKTIYDSRWVRLGLVDVEVPNGQRWDYHVVHLDRVAIALPMTMQAPEDALPGFSWGRHITTRLVWVNPAAATPAEHDEEGEHVPTSV